MIVRIKKKQKVYLFIDAYLWEQLKIFKSSLRAVNEKKGNTQMEFFSILYLTLIIAYKYTILLNGVSPCYVCGGKNKCIIISNFYFKFKIQIIIVKYKATIYFL